MRTSFRTLCSPLLASLFFALVNGAMAQVPAYVSSTGLLSWYGFNNNAQDGSGHGNHGVGQNVFSIPDRNGVANAAYGFNGSSSWINIANTLLPASYSSYTISYWMRTPMSTPGMVLSDRGTGGWAYKYVADVNSTGLSGRALHAMHDGATLTNTVASSTAGLTTDVWHHVVVTLDAPANTLRMYVDGALSTTTTSINPGAWNSASTGTTIGVWRGPAGSDMQHYFAGDIDDIGFWNRALGGAEIASLHSGIAGPCPLGTPCDDGDLCTANDVYQFDCTAFPLEIPQGSSSYSNTLPTAAALLMNPFKLDVPQRRWRVQYMFLKDELDTASALGICSGAYIEQLGFWINQAIAANAPQRTVQITVTVKHAPLGVNNLSAGFDNSVDPSAGCFSQGALVVPSVGAAGWRTVPISPFAWDGVRNIIVELAVGAAAGGGGNVAGGLPVRYVDTGANLTYSSHTSPLYPSPGNAPCSPATPTSSLCGWNNLATALGNCNANGGAFGASNYRPVIRFGGTSTPSCVCAGTFQDGDGDGVCDEDDKCLGPEPGSACSDGDPATTNDVINAFCQCEGSTGTVRVALKAMLEGAAVLGSSNMQDQMRASGYVPINEPYSGMGYAFVTGGGESTTVPVLSATGLNAVVDWVLLELRDATTPAARISTRAALIQRDGDVVDVDGSSPVAFSALNGSYHIAIRHRNHLGVMSAAPIALNNSSTALDLTLPATPTWGTDARKNVFEVMMLWSGNVSFNTTLSYTGPANDRDPILSAIGATTPNGSVIGYRKEDTNMDAVVKYTGSGNDRDVILQNVGSTTPNAVRVQQLP